MPPPPERRDHTRFKVKVPAELHFEDSNAPFRCATSDLSLDGCYIESMFPFPIGTSLELKLNINDSTLLVVGVVITNDPQVGNGIKFTRMLPEDVEELRAFLDAIEKGAIEKEVTERGSANKNKEEK
jgi:hypothetical protein